MACFIIGAGSFEENYLILLTAAGIPVGKMA